MRHSSMNTNAEKNRANICQNFTGEILGNFSLKIPQELSGGALLVKFVFSPRLINRLIRCN